MKSHNKKDSIIRLLRVIFFSLVAIFLVRYFRKNITELRNMEIHLNKTMFVVSMLFFFVYQTTVASLWHYITCLNGCNVGHGEAVLAYLCSILGKYIPGKVFMLAARMPIYEKRGASLQKVVVCFFLENICTLLGAAFLFLISLFFFPNNLLDQYKFFTIGLIVLFFVCLNPKIINWGLGILGKIFKRDDLQIPMTYGQMLKVVILFILNWLIVGTGFYLLVTSMYPLPVNQLLFAGGIYGLSTIIGIMALFTPSGLGVREGIIAAGLLMVMPESYVVVVSIVSRLWATIAELILIGIAFLINKILKIRRKREGRES